MEPTPVAAPPRALPQGAALREASVEALFEAAGALRRGHFLLKSGRHGDAYVEKFAVLADPAATSELCGFWAAAHRRDDGTAQVDLVAGPTTGGVILSFETARQLGVRSIFAEEVRDADGRTRREFRRGFLEHLDLARADRGLRTRLPSQRTAP